MTLLHFALWAAILRRLCKAKNWRHSNSFELQVLTKMPQINEYNHRRWGSSKRHSRPLLCFGISPSESDQSFCSDSYLWVANNEAQRPVVEQIRSHPELLICDPKRSAWLRLMQLDYRKHARQSWSSTTPWQAEKVLQVKKAHMHESILEYSIPWYLAATATWDGGFAPRSKAAFFTHRWLHCMSIL